LGMAKGGVDASTRCNGLDEAARNMPGATLVDTGSVLKAVKCLTWATRASNRRKANAQQMQPMQCNDSRRSNVFLRFPKSTVFHLYRVMAMPIFSFCADVCRSSRTTHHDALDLPSTLFPFPWVPVAALFPCSSFFFLDATTFPVDEL